MARPAKPFATASRSSSLYGTARWRTESKAFLQGKRCVDCGATATITDHEPPHRGNEVMFWDMRTWVPRCKPHHDAKTGREVAQRMSPKRPSEAHPGMVRA